MPRYTEILISAITQCCAHESSWFAQLHIHRAFLQALTSDTGRQSFESQLARKSLVQALDLRNRLSKSKLAENVMIL